MSTRSDNLATKVEQSIEGLLAAVEVSTPQQWAARCSDGEWTQGFAAFHAAMNITTIAETVKNVAEGQLFPAITMDSINAENAVQAKEHANCTKAETIDVIKNSAPTATNIVRSLTDVQLDRKVQLMEGMPETTVEMMIQMAMVGHPTYHLQTITGAR